MRNIIDKTTKKYHEKVRQDVNANNIKAARMIFKEMPRRDYTHLLDSALRVLENGFEYALAVLNFLYYYHQKLRTINHIERLNHEIRRKGQVITIFNGVDNVIRMIDSVLIEINQRTCPHKYVWRNK